MEAIIIGGSAGLYLIKELVKYLKYKKTKKKYKKKLYMAFGNNNKLMIKKYIRHLKDFDRKNKTEKTSKYLQHIADNLEYLNEDNVLSLQNDFYMIEYINESKDINKTRLEKHLDKKIKQLEQKNTEVKIREDMISQKMAIKAQKMKRKNKPIRRI